jgi:hypothetical protein
VVLGRATANHATALAFPAPSGWKIYGRKAMPYKDLKKCDKSLNILTVSNTTISHGRYLQLFYFATFIPSRFAETSQRMLTFSAVKL